MATSRAKLFELAYPDLSISEQYLALVASGQGESHITDHDRTVVWQGVLKPMAFSRRYFVTVSYTKGRSPSCIVTNPSLEELANGKCIPHTYTNKTKYKGTQLCLYLPYIVGKNKVSEWSPKLSLVETIIPWASLWLVYFEDWLACGKWRGGGIEHDPEDSYR